ncbi:GNAT family N-acetyltransferase [Otoolea muris]|uniref:GNAT family N-acetyltransferase n=1 Tax=Otoolea muris TaxID=2941515 RepID=UPI00203D222E|nr:GNAT family protein [Otoolea muris]
MLKGNVVGLRAVEESDLNKLLEWRNQPEYRKFFREYRELSMKNQKMWFEQKVIQDEHTQMFSIIDLSQEELLGACGLCYIDWINRSADFSVYIGKDGLYIDNMYAVDAAQIMIRYSFEELNLHRLWAEIYETDNKKKEMFEALGFTHEATHKETHWTGGKWVDSWYYRLLRNNMDFSML